VNDDRENDPYEPLTGDSQTPRATSENGTGYEAVTSTVTQQHVDEAYAKGYDAGEKKSNSEAQTLMGHDMPSAESNERAKKDAYAAGHKEGLEAGRKELQLKLDQATAKLDAADKAKSGLREEEDLQAGKKQLQLKLDNATTALAAAERAVTEARESAYQDGFEEAQEAAQLKAETAMKNVKRAAAAAEKAAAEKGYAEGHAAAMEEATAVTAVGDWDLGTISATTLNWKETGETDEISLLSTGLSLVMDDDTHTATLQENGTELLWDDGDIWTRQSAQAKIDEAVAEALKAAEQGLQTRIDEAVAQALKAALVTSPTPPGEDWSGIPMDLTPKSRRPRSGSKIERSKSRTPAIDEADGIVESQTAWDLAEKAAERFEAKLEVVDRMDLDAGRGLAHAEEEMVTRARRLSEANNATTMSPEKPLTSPGGRDRSYSKLVPTVVKHVFLWDLDDTLVPWDSMAKGKLPGGKHWFEDNWLTFSKEWQNTKLFGEELKQSQIDALDAGMDPNHHLASFNSLQASDVAENLQAALIRYPEIKELYERYGRNQELPSADLVRLLEETDAMSDGWLTAGQEALRAATKVEGSVNVIVTASKLMAAVAKLMMFGLHEQVDAGHVYSCWMEGTKQDVFDLFQKKHRKAKFMAIGDGKHEEAAAKALKMGFVKINAQKGSKAAVADLNKLTKKFTDMA